MMSSSDDSITMDTENLLLSSWAAREALLFSRAAKARVALKLVPDKSGSFSTSSPLSQTTSSPLAPTTTVRRNNLVIDDPQLLVSSPDSAKKVRDSIMQSKIRGPTLRDGISQANAAAAAHDLSVAPWIFAAWGASGAETPSSRSLRIAHEAARARIARLLPGPLGLTSPTVGFVHAPKPLLIRRAAVKAERSAGGPAAYAPTANASATARSRKSAPAGTTQTSFSRTRRWELNEAAARSERITEMLKESKKRINIRPTPISTSVPLLMPKSIEKLQEKDENSSESDNGIFDKDDVVCVSTGSGATMLHRHSYRSAAAISTNNNADENREWNNISFSERKEEETDEEEEKVIVNYSPPPDIIPANTSFVPITPPFGSTEWAILEASRLRTIGVRRAITKALFGASAIIDGPLPPRAPADVLRAYNPAARATTLNAPRVADEPRQILAAARRRWRIVRALRRAAVAPLLPIILPTDAPLPPRDPRDYAPHNVLPFGPLALPNGRLASEAPSLILARVRRAVSADTRAAKLADPHAARAASASRTPTVLRKHSSCNPPTHTPSVADVAAWKEYDKARRDYFIAVAEVARADAMARTIAAAKADAVAELNNYSSSEDDDIFEQRVEEAEEEEDVGLIIASRPVLNQLLASDTLSGSTTAEKISADVKNVSSPFARTARALKRAKDLRLAGEEDNVRRLRGRDLN